jgi:hypothetical protein
MIEENEGRKVASGKLLSKESSDQACWVVIALYIVASSTFLLVIVSYLDSPLRFDETEFARQAGGILKHGVPKLLYSEERHLYPQQYHGYDAYYGMWHPPLYLYSLAASAALFGTGNAPMRAVGLVWFVLSLWLAWRVTRLLNDQPDSATLQAIPLALAMLTPLLSEGSLYLDIDNTSLTVGLLLFIWFFLRSPVDESTERLLILVLMFSLCLWSKLTTPFIMLGCVLLYHWLNGSFRKGIYQSLTIGIFGTGLFLLTYWIYCYILEYPFWFMLEVIYWGKRNTYTSWHSLMEVLHSLRWNIVWISPPIVMLLGTVVAVRIWNYMFRGKLEKVDFLVLFAVVGLAAYTIWGARWGKYTFPLVLIGVIAVANQLPNALRSITITRRTLFAALILFLAVFHLIAVDGLQVRLPGINLHTTGFWDAISDVRNLNLLWTLVAFVVFFTLASLFSIRGKKGMALLFVLVVYVLVANPINTVKIVVSSDDRSPYRALQEQGFTETVQHLNSTLDEESVILSPKDVGYYFKGRYYETEGLQEPPGGSTLLRHVAFSGQIRFVVDSVKFPTIANRDLLLRSSPFVPVRRIGDFVIYENQGGGVFQRG